MTFTCKGDTISNRSGTQAGAFRFWLLWKGLDMREKANLFWLVFLTLLTLVSIFPPVQAALRTVLLEQATNVGCG